jgi:hypothetical protein
MDWEAVTPPPLVLVLLVAALAQEPLELADPGFERNRPSRAAPRFLPRLVALGHREQWQHILVRHDLHLILTPFPVDGSRGRISKNASNVRVNVARFLGFSSLPFQHRKMF